MLNMIKFLLVSVSLNKMYFVNFSSLFNPIFSHRNPNSVYNNFPHYMLQKIFSLLLLRYLREDNDFAGQQTLLSLPS